MCFPWRRSKLSTIPHIVCGYTKTCGRLRKFRRPPTNKDRPTKLLINLTRFSASLKTMVSRLNGTMLILRLLDGPTLVPVDGFPFTWSIFGSAQHFCLSPS
ncbi:unnamed protein product [Linum trigynum]|uniref:Uncharacterized protein n=1 Tax=Linum trigynum TaxID=586398 RepID=A0AAV2GCF6_9ROSI